MAEHIPAGAAGGGGETVSVERVGDGDEWAELLPRGTEARRQITHSVGGLLSAAQVASALGITVPGVEQSRARHELIALPLAGGQWGFPARQFAEDGRVRSEVAEVTRAGAHLDPWALLAILVDDVEDARGGLLLERLDDPAVLADVRNRLATYGVHAAA